MGIVWDGPVARYLVVEELAQMVAVYLLAAIRAIEEARGSLLTFPAGLL
jgi:hypothetical protein